MIVVLMIKCIILTNKVYVSVSYVETQLCSFGVKCFEKLIVCSWCDVTCPTPRHWLATYFVIWYGVPYMTYDIFAMYLSHYYRYRVNGHEDYKQHSLRTINSFIRREFLLVLHHIALLTILLPITLVRRRREVWGDGGDEDDEVMLSTRKLGVLQAAPLVIELAALR